MKQFKSLLQSFFSLKGFDGYNFCLLAAVIFIASSCTNTYNVATAEHILTAIDYKGKDLKKGDKVFLTGTLYNFGSNEIVWEVVEPSQHYCIDTVVFRSNDNGYYSNIIYKVGVIK